MSLIRGVQCKCLCPVCLVPCEELSNLSKTFTIRCSKTQGKELLKVLGLCAVAISHNVLWLIEHSDPHDAMSVDRLHTVHGGMGGKYLWGELKTILGDVGREALAAVEKFVEEFPRWHGLTHFTTVIHTTFTDGNKKRDLVMQAFYAALPVLTRRASPEGYCLLHVICSYLQLDSLIGLDVHTEQTLAMLDAEFLVFDAALNDYVEYATTSSIEDLKMDWNFPKTHLWTHTWWDITRKGAARNFSTCPNEKLHGPLKVAYLFHSNRKDVAKQILHVDHHRCIEMRLGIQDRAFQGLCKKFSDFINTSLLTYGYQLMRWVTIPADFQICKHHYLKVNYENTIDWRQSTDHLWYNPLFHGHLCFDCVLIQLTAERGIFVWLILMFKCKVPDVGAFQFALVQPYTAGIVGGSCRID
ncbi:hypothetical protein EDB19DRAFT_1837996 [Suillus lakei]|nr:hypothetical protein EDB19DRAFT_1837996 [Suillus lakei]